MKEFALKNGIQRFMLSIDSESKDVDMEIQTKSIEGGGLTNAAN